MRKILVIALVSAISGLVGGFIASAGILRWRLHDRAALISEFYAVENAVHVSPHSLRGKMDKGITDYTLVDLRSAQEYEKGHIAGAVSVPAYKDPDTSAYDEVDRIVAAFRDLPQDKDIIVYCYSTPCMTGRKIGKILAERGIYVQHLGVGWNEWRHFWTQWNHEHEWAITKPEDYIATGAEPGKPKIAPAVSPCVEGQFGC